MKVEYSKRAVSDLRRIADYHTGLDDPKVGERVAVGIREVVVGLERFPERGRPVAQRPGVHVALLVQYRYKIFYRVAGETLRIIHIRHTSRRPWPTD
jgi:toxin ParE1/3/4